MNPTIDTIPVATTPTGGWTDWPSPFLSGCTEPRPPGAPDLGGYWRAVEIEVDGESVADHRTLGLVTRIEQAGNRLIVTAGGVVHDMRCDGTLENGVNDVAEFDKATEIRVAASFEDGVHVLRPEGMPIEVRRWRDGDQLVWEYLGFTARMDRIADADADPADVPLR